MSKGAVFLDLPGLDGQRIGTYLMNEIVQWVQQWSEATVNSIELLAGQAHGDNKARRDWFYEQFGLVFDYTDPEHREGRSRPMLAGALVKVETWKQNITEHRMLDYLAAVLYAEERATSELQARDRACAQLIVEQRRAEARPVRWALRRLYIHYASTVLAGLVLTERILKSSISVLEAFNDVRNNKSLAHDNPILNYEESLLIFNHVAASIRFIKALETKIKAQAKVTEQQAARFPWNESTPF